MAKKKRQPVKKAVKKKAAKKKATKKTPAKKTTASKKKRTPTPKKTVEEEKPTTPPEDRGKKTPPKKTPRTKASDRKDFLEKGLIEFNVGDDLRQRFQSVHDALGNDDVLTTMTAIFTAGLDELGPTLVPGASGSLIDDGSVTGDDDEPYGEDFDDAFGDQILSRLGA